MKKLYIHTPALARVRSFTFIAPDQDRYVVNNSAAPRDARRIRFINPIDSLAFEGLMRVAAVEAWAG